MDKYLNLCNQDVSNLMTINKNEEKRSAGNTRMEISEFLEVDGKQIAVDMHGFLIDPRDWNQQVAKKQAELSEVEMSDEHWLVVNYIREQYEYSQCVPEARHILKYMKEKLGKDRSTRKYLYSLFPYGYAIQACRIAGTRVPLKTMLDL